MKTCSIFLNITRENTLQIFNLLIQEMFLASKVRIMFPVSKQLQNYFSGKLFQL
jgi:hypothetical protein